MKNLLPSFRICILVFAVTFATAIYAANPSKTVSQVTSATTISEAVDYHITSTTPFATAGSIDIQNPDAVVIFDNIKPSTVISKHLSKVTVNGVALTNNSNCRVSIYKHGAIVLPHSDHKNPDGTVFYPLTTYAGDNCTGETKQYNGDGRKTTTGSYPFRSFVLKRGYMVTMANNPDGTGYSHCYIANHEDRVVQLRKELAGKVGFFRIFRWQWPAKKGVSDLNGEEARSGMNASWFYTWGSGENARVDAEFVPQRHHENGIANGGEQKWAWPSFGEINGRDNTCTHVLGQNEPDNTSGGGEVNTYVSTIAYDTRGDGKGGTTTLMDVAHEFLYSGMRIGTFACCNPKTDWVTDYVNRCREANIRVDFVATHYYIGGQSPANCINSLKSLYNATGLPVWVTEWNNGANWTTEGGFNTDSNGWYNWGSGNDNKMNGVWLTDVLKRAESETWLERLAVYHAVESKRELWNWNTNQPTEGGKLYAAYNSGFAYDDKNEYFMTWNHKSPADLELTFNASTKRAKLTWDSPNGKQTDSISVERKIEDESNDWVVINKIYNPAGTTLTYQDTLASKTGTIFYRIKNHDSDGRVRATGEVSVTIGSSTGNDMIQYGSLNINNTNEIQTDFSKELPTAPAVFMGIISYKNTGVHPVNLVTSTTKKNFKYKAFPLRNQGTSELTKEENVPFMALQLGNYTYGNMDIEVDSVKVKQDTMLVKFNKPFPEGVTPVVITEMKPTIKTRPYLTKICDVTNEGFKVIAFHEAAENTTLTLAQPLFYAAFTPGSECIDEEKGIVISAGVSSSTLYGASQRQIYFTNAEDTMMLKDPLVFATLQTNNFKGGTILRRGSDFTIDINGEEYINGTRIRRYTDSTIEGKPSTNSTTADYAGWVTITADPAISTGIDEVITVKSENPIEVDVINRCIYVKNRSDFEIFTLGGAKVASNASQQPGVYIVRSGKQAAKVVVN
jgi:hypothetical protein